MRVAKQNELTALSSDGMLSYWRCLMTMKKVNKLHCFFMLPKNGDNTSLDVVQHVSLYYYNANKSRLKGTFRARFSTQFKMWLVVNVACPNVANLRTLLQVSNFYLFSCIFFIDIQLLL